jgi:hypothetical protein
LSNDVKKQTPKISQVSLHEKSKEFLQKNLATVSFFPGTGTHQNRLDVMVEQHVHELRQKNNTVLFLFA